MRYEAPQAVRYEQPEYVPRYDQPLGNYGVFTFVCKARSLFRFKYPVSDIYFCLIKAIFLLKERSDRGGTISRLFVSLSVCP